jgi:hypothetical protein
MRIPPRADKRRELIRQALLEKAPRSYRELKNSGKLEQFLVDHDLAMVDSYDPLAPLEQVRKEHPDLEKKDGLEFIRRLNQAVSQYAETVLATWLDFSDPVEEDH